MNKLEENFEGWNRGTSLSMVLDEEYQKGQFEFAVKLDKEIERFREAGREFLLTGSDDSIYRGLNLPG